MGGRAGNEVPDDDYETDDGQEVTEWFGADNEGWNYTRIYDWIALCPDLTDFSIRLYIVIRSFIIDNAKGRRRRGDRIKQLTHAELAHLLDVSESTVKRGVKVLEKVGLVTNPDAEIRTRQVYNPETKRYEVRKWRRYKVNDAPAPDYAGYRNAWDKLDDYRDKTGGGPGEIGRGVQAALLDSADLTPRSDQRKRTTPTKPRKAPQKDVSAGHTEGSDLTQPDPNLTQAGSDLTGAGSNLLNDTPSEQQQPALKKPLRKAPRQQAPRTRSPLRGAPPPDGDGPEQSPHLRSVITEGDQLLRDLQHAREEMTTGWYTVRQDSPELNEISHEVARADDVRTPATAYLRAFRLVEKSTSTEKVDEQIARLVDSPADLSGLDYSEIRQLAIRTLLKALARAVAADPSIATPARRRRPPAAAEGASAASAMSAEDSAGKHRRREFTRPSQRPVAAS